MNKIYPFLQKASKFIQIFIYNILLKTFKRRDNYILIASNTKKELQGNLLYIYKELQKYKYNIHILLTNNDNFFVKIKYNLQLLYYVAISKYILIDDFFPIMYTLKIRSGSKFIQVWHALGAYKKIGYSRKDIGNKNSLTHKNYTDTIVSSNHIIKNYAEAFGIDENKVHPIGIPRTDIFFDKEKINETIKNIYDKYPFLKHKNIILFAPTFRGSGRKSAHYPEKYINLDNIYMNLQDNDIFIIKLHPFIKNKIKIKDEYKNKIIDLTDYKDINDLLLISNLLITDYSSVIFEYAFLNKPILFYVPDLEEYNSQRSFFYDYNDYMYGVTAHDECELIEGIKSKKIDKDKLKIFKEKFLNKCDGQATKRFVEELIIKEK